MTTLTVVMVVVMLYGALNRQGYGRALALGGSTAAGAAAVIGSVAVPTFYAVAFGAVIALALDLLGDARRGEPRPHRPLPPGIPMLMLFVAWSVLVTILAPILFDGTTVVTPLGENQLRAGQYTTSNLAQCGYLVIGFCVVLFLARHRRAGPELIGLVAGLTVLLSAWRYTNTLVGIPFPSGFFDNSPFYVYVDKAPGDVERFRGILSEPSALAASCLVTVSYMLARARYVRGRRRVGVLAMAAIAGYLGAISTSATFVVASVVVALIAVLSFLVGFLRRRVRISALLGLVGCALGVLALWILPIVTAFVGSTVDDKVKSASYDERSGADTTAYDVFFHTFGFGSGLGSNRASSFLAGLLGATGVVGAVLFALTIAILISRAAPVHRFRPVIWALVSTLALKAVAGPDLSDSSGILFMSLGLLSQAAMSVPRRGARGIPAPREGAHALAPPGRPVPALPASTR